MIEYDSTNSPCKIIIPVSNRQEVFRYQQSVLGILNKIEIGNCGSALNEDLKVVYKLLLHITPEDDLQLNEVYNVRSDSREEEKVTLLIK